MEIIFQKQQTDYKNDFMETSPMSELVAGLAPGKYVEVAPVPAPAKVGSARFQFPKLQTPLIQIPEAAIAARYVDELLTPAMADKIEGIIDSITKERRNVERFSIVCHRQIIHEHARVVSNDPTPANLKKMRELRSMDEHDLHLMQSAAINRMAKIGRELLAPLMPEIYTKIARLLEIESRLVEKSEKWFYDSFSLPQNQHPLAQSLSATAESYKHMALYAEKCSDIPSLAEILTSVFRNPARVKHDLSIVKKFIPDDEFEFLKVCPDPVISPLSLNQIAAGPLIVK